jgi:hypothetical protein
MSTRLDLMVKLQLAVVYLSVVICNTRNPSIRLVSTPASDFSTSDWLDSLFIHTCA